MESQGLSTLLGAGVYSLPQAARLACVPSRSVRRWLEGYCYKRGGEIRSRLPVFKRSRAGESDEVLTVTFQDLIEIRFVHAFREIGVSWPVIRLAAEKAQQRFHTAHPFSTEAFVSDGRRIFEQLREEGVHEKKLVDLISDQYCFRAVLLPGFRAQIDASSEGVQRWWPLGKRKHIVLDPARQFGQPIIDNGGVPTAIIANAVQTMGSEKAVSRWYEVELACVRQAVSYEQKLAA